MCPVCLERFTPADGPRCPKLLPTCGHCFCLCCLNHLVARARKNEDEFLHSHVVQPHSSMTWRCPECRHDIDARTPAALPNSLQTLRLLDVMQTFAAVTVTPRAILERLARASASAGEAAQAEAGGETTLHIV